MGAEEPAAPGEAADAADALGAPGPIRIDGVEGAGDGGDLDAPLREGRADAVGVAAGISVLRIVSDRHWASDVLAGAALGTTVGAVVSSVQLRDGAPTQRGFSIGAGGRAITYAGSF